MSSAAIPVISTLASMVEVAASLGRAEDVAAIAEVLRRSAKWMLPVTEVALVVRDEDAWRRYPGGGEVVPAGALADALMRQATVTRARVDAPNVVEMVLPLTDAADVLGALVLVGFEGQLATIDRGACHLLALNVASAVRAAILLRRERAARQLAEEAIRARERLAHAITHDLRNPLAVVMTQVGMLFEEHPDVLDADARDDLDESLRTMKAMIDELLDVARVAAGGALVLDTHATELGPLVTRAVRSAQLLSSRHAIVIAAEPAVSAPVDGARLRRVLDNLLGNAIKYSPKGGEVAVTLARVVDEQGARAEIRVRDPGIGIPAADVPKLFQPFQRAGNVGSIRGTGVGLASARDVIVAHGGTLEVESAEGQGSSFIVRLPLA